MKLKKYVMAAIILALMLTLTACGKSENPESESQVNSGSNQSDMSNTETEKTKLDNCLPFGLKFGDSFDIFINKLKAAGLTDNELPQLEKAQSGDGYAAKPAFTFVSTLADDYLGYTVVGSDASQLPLTMMFAFNFNQDKELYEWYWFGGDLEWSDEAQIEYVLNCQIDTYNDVFGFEGSYRKTNDEIVYIWETDTIGANIILRDNVLALVFHSIVHDLNH